MKVLVLSGGGARGSYQAGCLEGLIARGQKWDAIVGTSVGALNAAGLSYIGMERLKHVWLNEIKSPSDILDRHWLITMPWKRGIYSLKPLKELLKEELSNKTASIPFWVGVCDFADMRVSFIPHDQNTRVTIQNVLASSSMPVIMDPVDVTKVDGGVRDIVPMSFPIKSLNATEITVISCAPYSENQLADGVKWEAKFPKIVSYLTRTIETMTSEIQWQDMQLCQIYNDMPGKRRVKVTVYAPRHRPILEALDFEPELIRRAWALGNTMAEQPVIQFGG